MNSCAPQQTTNSSAPRHPSRFSGWRAFLTIFGLTLAAVGTALLEPLPSHPPDPRFDSVLCHLEVPGVGPVWAELGGILPGRKRAALAVHPLHPEVRIHPVYGHHGELWSVLRSHQRVAELRWDGHAFHLRETQGTTGEAILVPDRVTRMLTMESKAGLQILGRGIKVEWSTRRPVWAHPSPVDQAAERESKRRDGESWHEFFETVRWMLGNRLGMELFENDPLSGTWPCERWQVVYHRSERAISILHCSYSNLGGVHGNRHVSHLNLIEGPEGVESVSFADLFRHRLGWQDEVRDLLLKDLERQGATWAQPEGPPAIVEEFLGPVLTFDDEQLAGLTFTASADGVFVHFEEYEAGTYVVLLTWQDLGPWIRPDILDAFPGTSALPGLPPNQIANAAETSQ